MKILTILGTRPEIIRLSEVIKKIDKDYDQKIVHTGQNFDYELDRIFFKNFKLRKPDYYLNAIGTFGNQLSKISYQLEKIIFEEKPDKFLVLGDTNSSLGAIVAKRAGLKVYHMEAGNRSYNKESPEEINRKIIDHSSDILLPYTKGSALNLMKEGIAKDNIIVTGNPINEIIIKNKNKIKKSKILEKLELQKKQYFLITLHREENVDDPKKLISFVNIMNSIVRDFHTKIIWPIHPRTLFRLKKIQKKLDKNVILIKPLGFFDFTFLEKNSKCILTDSGTVQEEAAIFKIPCLVIREKTERPETIMSGSAKLVHNDYVKIKKNMKFFIKTKHVTKRIPEYDVKNVSSIILGILKKY
tara:strand:- start:2507 stop:3577 length:1071 start_codon:yes stop_codon:yes gene_type:complete